MTGASLDNTGASKAGSAYLFDGALRGTTNTPLLTINNPTPAADDEFGRSVATTSNGDLLIGAYLDDTGASNAGSAYLFDGIDGSLLLTINNPAPGVNDTFGFSIATTSNGDLLIGAFEDDAGALDSGTVYLFNGIDGSLLLTINNPTPETGDLFGRSVATTINGDLLIAAPFDDTGATDAGSVYLFDGTDGSLLLTINNPTPDTGDQFGRSVATTSNGDLLIGAIEDDTGATDAGSVYLFEGILSESTPTPGNIASGDNSTAFGYFTTAQPFASFVIGQYNEISGTTTNWVDTDPLFVIGNGVDTDNPNNTVTVLKNGNVGIGISSPTQLLQVNGTIESISGGFKFPDGTIQSTASTNNIKNISAGIGLLGGGTTGDVTLDVDTSLIQSRVTGSCSVGSSISAINVDGTVTCETDDVGNNLWMQLLLDINYIAGKVGIGTTSPLHIMAEPIGGNPWTGQLYIEPTTDNFDAAITLKTTQKEDRVWTILAGSGAGSGSTNFRIYDSTAGIDRFNIDGLGNIGIGTTSPNSQLEVTGYIELATSSGMPPSADCDNPNEIGRMKVDSTNDNLYVCTNNGWQTK